MCNNSADIFNGIYASCCHIEYSLFYQWYYKILELNGSKAVYVCGKVDGNAHIKRMKNKKKTIKMSASV